MFLSELYRYPVKSGQAQSLKASPVGLLGLQGDRRWMMVEEENGRFLTSVPGHNLARSTRAMTTAASCCCKPWTGAVAGACTACR